MTCVDRDFGWIVLILRNGFVFAGKTRRVKGIGYLDGFNVRWWAQRHGGLPEFAEQGPILDDKLDRVRSFEFSWSESNVIGHYPCNSEPWEKWVAAL